MLRRFIPSVPTAAHRRFSNISGSEYFFAIGGVTRVTPCDPKIVPRRRPGSSRVLTVRFKRRRRDCSGPRPAPGHEKRVCRDRLSFL